MTTDTPKIRTDVPLDLHPGATLLGVGRPLDVKDTIGARVYQAAHEAFSTLHNTYASINDAERAAVAAIPLGKQVNTRMRGGRAVSEHGREVEIAEATNQAYDRASLAVDRRLKEIGGYREALAKRVSDAIDDPEHKTPLGISQAAEIRNHLKSLSETKRQTFVNAAIERGDKTTLAAVLHAPAYLSGLKEDAHASVRDRAAMKFAPVEHAQLMATDTVTRRLAAGVNTLARRRDQVTELARGVAVSPGPAIDALAKGGAK